MHTEQIRNYVTRYLEATECHVVESHPAYMTVRLSPEADKALMNRPYYWSFVERTGVEPEPVSITFVFDQEQYDQLDEQRQKKPEQVPGGIRDLPKGNSLSSKPDEAPPTSILAHYFGISPSTSSSSLPNRHGRVEPITFGCSRLNQIFTTARQMGSFVHLYEQPQNIVLSPGRTASYTSYLAVNYKIEYVCDIKRNELHSLGLCLSTGEIIRDFQGRIKDLNLSPRLPAHIHINDMLSLPRAVYELENFIEQYVKTQDHRWALEAEERMYDELERIKHFYQEMIQNSNDDEERANIQQEYRARQDEIAWQYKPRILTSAVNCGIFHLLARL